MSGIAGPMATRRTVVVGLSAVALLAAAGLPLPAFAAEDFVIDWQGAPQVPAVAASLAAQIALVRALEVSDEAMTFFRTQVITVDREPGTKTRAGPRGVFFARESSPPDNPVLLHELIHRWQFVHMPGGRDNPDVDRLFAAAKASGKWPVQSYMLSNRIEFFAMMASVVLHGRAARPPFTRAAVRENAPEVYAFVVREFGLRV